MKDLLISIPSDIACSALLHFLQVKDLVNLDTATLNIGERQILHELLLSGHYFNEEVSSDARMVTWIIKRNMFIRHMYVTSATPADVLEQVTAHRLCKMAKTLRWGDSPAICSSTIVAFFATCHQLQTVQFESICDALGSVLSSLPAPLNTVHTFRSQELTQQEADIVTRCFPSTMNFFVDQASPSTIVGLMNKMTNVCSVQLGGGSSSDFTDNDLISLQYCPNLRHFIFSLDWRARGTHVTDIGVCHLAQCFPNLVSFSLNRQSNITDSGIIAIARNCPHLRAVSTPDCHNVTDRSLFALANCRELVSCYFNGCRQLTDSSLTHLAKSRPNLHILHILECPLITDLTLTALATSCLGLRHFVMGPAVGVTDTGLCALLRQCTKLRFCLIFRCPELTDRSLLALCEVNRGRLAMKVTGSKMTDAIASTVRIAFPHLNVKICER